VRAAPDAVARLRTLLVRWTESEAFLEGKQTKVLAQTEARLPRPDQWDVAVGYPTSVLRSAENDDQLRDIDHDLPFLAYRLAVYGPLGRDGLGDFDRLLDGPPPENLLVASFEKEPACHEALAALFRRRARVALPRLLVQARMTLSSVEIRDVLHRHSDAVGIVELRPAELGGDRGLPAARIGIAVSSLTREPTAARGLALAIERERAAWCGPIVELSEAKRFLLGASEADFEAFDEARLISTRGIVPLPVYDWIETAALVAFALAFGWIVLLAGRRGPAARRR